MRTECRPEKQNKMSCVIPETAALVLLVLALLLSYLKLWQQVGGAPQRWH